jgi:glutathione S-transferase
MITIYHMEARRSERVVWLLEELGVPYKLEFTPGDLRASMAIVQRSGHPYPMAPIVADHGTLLAESGAILETLLNRYGEGRLRPAIDAPEHPAYLEWLHFAEGTAMARFSMEAVQRLLTPSKNPEAEARRTGASAKLLAYIDNHLSTRPYFAGQAFSAADIMMQFPLRIGASIAAGKKGYPSALLQPADDCFASYPNVAAFLGRMAERPAFQHMMTITMPQGWPPI